MMPHHPRCSNPGQTRSLFGWAAVLTIISSQLWLSSAQAQDHEMELALTGLWAADGTGIGSGKPTTDDVVTRMTDEIFRSLAETGGDSQSILDDESELRELAAGLATSAATATGGEASQQGSMHSDGSNRAFETSINSGGGEGAAACTGDSNSNGRVTVDELVAGVGCALGSQTSCTAFDADENNRVEVNELVEAVNNALRGCGGAPDATPSPTTAPTPTRTSQPRAPQSVCGGPVTSAPALCNLRTSPSVVQQSGSMGVSFDWSDLEGDVDAVCLGLGFVGSEPLVECSERIPRGRIINEHVELPPLPIDLSPGTYSLSIGVKDARGHLSNTVAVTFQVVGISSVCGGFVSSVPRLCNFAVIPNPVWQFGAISFSLGVSDYEGDISTTCVGFAPLGLPPIVQCSPILPGNQLINQFLQTHFSPVTVPPGAYWVGYNVVDAQGNLSNTVSTTYTVTF